MSISTYIYIYIIFIYSFGTKISTYGPSLGLTLRLSSPILLYGSHLKCPYESPQNPRKRDMSIFSLISYYQLKSDVFFPGLEMRVFSLLLLMSKTFTIFFFFFSSSQSTLKEIITLWWSLCIWNCFSTDRTKDQCPHDISYLSLLFFFLLSYIEGLCSFFMFEQTK